MCLIYLVLEGSYKSKKNRPAVGVTIGCGAAKSGKNTNFLVIIRVRLSQKIALLDLMNQTRFKNRTAIQYVWKECVITVECV